MVIARYGTLFRGSKADNAHNAGAAALLIYSDPFDYAKEVTYKTRRIARRVRASPSRGRGGRR